MSTKDPVDWMLSDAIGTLVRAERPHQQFLKLRPLVGTREPCWEPPIDVLETDREVLILIALPGVDPGDVEAVIDEGVLVVSGRRVLPPNSGTPEFSEGVAPGTVRAPHPAAAGSLHDRPLRH
jgi:HSP20 family protein